MPPDVCEPRREHSTGHRDGGVGGGRTEDAVQAGSPSVDDRRFSLAFGTTVERPLGAAHRDVVLDQLPVALNFILVPGEPCTARPGRTKIEDVEIARIPEKHLRRHSGRWLSCRIGEHGPAPVSPPGGGGRQARDSPYINNKLHKMQIALPNRAEQHPALAGVFRFSAPVRLPPIRTRLRRAVVGRYPGTDAFFSEPPSPAST